MASLGDAFKKAGLISKKEHRQIQHESRIHRKEAGREGLNLESQEREQAQQRRVEEERARQRAIERERLAQKAASEARARARDLVRAKAVTENIRGARRFHFVEPGGEISWILVSDDIGRRLEAGEFGIAEAGLIIPRAVAVEARSIDPTAIRFLNG